MQSWNWAGVKLGAWLLVGGRVRREALLVPRLAVATLDACDWAQLRDRHGIRAVCFDKDNTLTAPYAAHVDARCEEAVRTCVAVFGRGAVCVVSNSIGYDGHDAGHPGARAFEAATGLHVVRHRRPKPNAAREVLGHLAPLRPGQIALVGDRLLTDTAMANGAGMFSVHVRTPLTVVGDNWLARVLRAWENRWLAGQGAALFPGK